MRAEQIALAARLAETAHANQRYDDEQPYINHVERVATRVRREGGTSEQIAAAWLHDVVEDCEVTEERLRGEGLDEAVIRLVLGLSRRPGERYHADYIVRCAADPMLRLIKRCDVEENYASLPGKFAPDRAEGMKRRYERALEMLKEPSSRSTSTALS